MRAGWYISGAGHFLLILVLLFGGLFVPDRLPEMTVSEVSVISEAEYAALTPPAEAPEIATDAPSVSAPVEDTAPDAPVEDSAPEVSEPAPVEEPETPEATPDVEVPQPIPDAIVEDDAPVIETPPTDIDGSAAIAEGVVQPAPRVAPTPSIAPPPDAEVAPDRIEDSAPDPTAEPEEQPEPDEPDEPAAPEEASDRIVTEAEETPDRAPASSMRPRTRPARAARTVETPETPTDEPSDDATAEAIAAAVAAANQPAETEATAPSGPPLTGGEKDAFRVAVSSCWVVDPGAQSAGVVVTVGFSLGQDGRVQGDVSQVSASGGDPNTQRAAFDAARRAILRCQRDGFPLPTEKYAQWRDIEMTFNPEGMQFR